MSADNANPPDGGSGTQQNTAGEIEPGKTYTDAEVQAIIKNRLAHERSKLGDVADLRRKAAEFDRLENERKTESERAAEQIAQLQRDNEALKLSQLRADVAAKHGLTPTQAKRLVGANEDELAADAAELAKDLGIQPPGTPTGNGRPKPALAPVANAGSAGTDADAAPHPMNDWMRQRISGA